MIHSIQTHNVTKLDHFYINLKHQFKGLPFLYIYLSYCIQYIYLISD